MSILDDIKKEVIGKVEEEVNNAEINEYELTEMPGDDEDFESDRDAMTLSDHIAMWRKEYKQVFKTEIDEDVYIWRKLKRSEYKSITKSQLNEESEQAQNWYRQDEITKTVLLYPFDAEEAIEESAGISVVISQDCLIRSGFGAITKQI